jgi:hypothetical protein
MVIVFDVCVENPSKYISRFFRTQAKIHARQFYFMVKTCWLIFAPAETHKFGREAMPQPTETMLHEVTDLRLSFC